MLRLPSKTCLFLGKASYCACLASRSCSWRLQTTWRLATTRASNRRSIPSSSPETAATRDHEVRINPEDICLSLHETAHHCDRLVPVGCSCARGLQRRRTPTHLLRMGIGKAVAE